jgi:hypothetical protein
VPQRAAEFVIEMREAELTRPCHDNLMRNRALLDRPGLEPLAGLLEPHHTLAEALAALYATARTAPETFAGLMLPTDIEVDQIGYRADVMLNIEGSDGHPTYQPDLEYELPKPKGAADLRILARMSGVTVLAAARAAGRPE